jgi:hypothetical protein
MFTEVFIVDFPDCFDDLCSQSERFKHRSSVAEYFPDLPIEFLGGLSQIDAKQDIWLTRAVFAHVLRLFIETGVYRVILVPGD